MLKTDLKIHLGNRVGYSNPFLLSLGVHGQRIASDIGTVTDIMVLQHGVYAVVKWDGYPMESQVRVENLQRRGRCTGHLINDGSLQHDDGDTCPVHEG